MNILLLGDLSEKIIKSCAKNDFQVITLSSLITSAFSQGEYRLKNDFSKQENILWEAILFGGKAHTSVASITNASDCIFNNICSKLIEYVDGANGMLIHFNVYSKKLLTFFEEELTTKFTIVFNDSGLSETIVEPELLEILYSRPKLKYVYTKKSSIKSILSELMSAATKFHKYAFRPYKLGLDISMNSTGVGCTCISNDGEMRLMVGRIRTKRTKLDIDRLAQIEFGVSNVKVRDRDGCNFVVDITYASEVCVEGGALAMVHGAFRIGQFSGMLLAYLCAKGPKKKFFYVAPTSLKKIITGYGRAAKELMIICIKEKLNLDLEINDDEADALCLLHCLTTDSISLKDDNLE